MHSTQIRIFTTASNSAFITALYVVVVPLILRRFGRRVWLAIGIAMVGLAFYLFRVDLAHRERVVVLDAEGAWIIESYMREHGADKIAFDLIVASGPNAALPHAIPGDRVFKSGEPIIVDIGCRVEYYNSDLTRTVILGEPDDQFRRIYGIVLKAQLAAIKRIKAGMKGKRADALARNVIDKAGHGNDFGHGLGHGVGLQVHEGPRASRLSKDVYKANMTLTIEPGIYIPGWGGVRIEDLVVIHEDGVDVLSDSPKELKQMVLGV